MTGYRRPRRASTKPLAIGVVVYVAVVVAITWAWWGVS